MEHYLQDIERIVGCKAFRRLAHKTQVFPPIRGDHFRTRLTHTLEVSVLARKMAIEEDINPYLTEAVALLHDIGHPPFGHAGEDELHAFMVEDGGFNHNKQALRIVTDVESYNGRSRGLGLQPAVIRGLEDKIKNCHSVLNNIVSTADTITYIVHDLEDAIRAGMLNFEVARAEIFSIVNTTAKGSACLATKYDLTQWVKAWITTSTVFRSEIRAYMERNVYVPVSGLRNVEKDKDVLRYLLQHYTAKKVFENKHELCDYVSGMTDRFAISEAKRHGYKT